LNSQFANHLPWLNSAGERSVQYPYAVAEIKAFRKYSISTANIKMVSV
jgi:hypothetical protein